MSFKEPPLFPFEIARRRPPGDRHIVHLSPGTSLHTDTGLGLHSGAFYVEMYELWLEVARENMEEAARRRLTDAECDALSLEIEAVGPLRPVEHLVKQKDEIVPAIVAVTASAIALDGFYGTVEPLVNPPKSNAKRGRKILEALKLGFELGAKSNDWLAELDWLFGLRDRAVHHDAKYQPMEAIRFTEETMVVGSEESKLYTADAAKRAYNFARGAVDFCAQNPKPSTLDWAGTHRSNKS